MDRRTFIASAAAATAAVGPLAAYARANRRRLVELTGWLSPVDHGPGHYFVLSQTPGARDPASNDVRDWAAGLVRVLPADARAMRPGKVALRGRLFQGHFADVVTGHAAGAVLTEAVII
jgi:hypothetical protein